MKHLVTNASYKILSLIVVMAIILSGVPMTAAAEDTLPDDYTYATSGVTVSGTEADAPIGFAPAAAGDNYEDLQSAMSAAEPDTITLSGDITNGTAELTVNGDKTLDLNGYDLTIAVSSGNGIKIASSAKLTITDSGTTGKLTVTNSFNGSASGASAGINTTDGTLVIESGTVIATGGTRGAGIGGGYNKNGGTIEISGGTVNATGGDRGAGIGGGIYGNSGTITISDAADVIATGGFSGAGIGGGGDGGSGDNIEITGGTVNAIGGSGEYGGGAGIGGGISGEGGGDSGTITISGDADVTAQGGDGGDGDNGGAGIGGGRGGYVDNIKIGGNSVVDATGGDGGAGIGGGMYGDGGDIEIGGDADVTATGGKYGAGIGGGQAGKGADVTITGGKVEAKSVFVGAGIGGGNWGIGGTVNISGGTVIATGNSGAGIGGGGSGNCSGGVVTISGNAEVTATSEDGGAGIGGGEGGDGGDVTITNAAKVEAIGGSGTAGNSIAIGKGNGGGSNGTVTVTGTYDYLINPTSNSATGDDVVQGSDTFTNDTDTFKEQKYILLTEPAPAISISLTPDDDKDFGSAEYGYGAQTAYSATINNTGDAPTGALGIALSGANAGSFTLSKTSISDIDVDGDDSFTVEPITGLDAGTYTATVTVSGGNGISKSFDVSFTVNQKDLTITGATHTKVYDGTTSATGATAWTFSGYATGDSAGDVTVSSYTAAYTSANMGTATINVTAMTLGGTKGGNYTATLPANGVAVTGGGITKKDINIGANDITYTGKTYDGTTSATGATITLTNANSGIISGDTVTASYTSATFDNADVGSHTVTFNGLSLTGADAGNYALSSNTATKSGVAISAKSLTLKADDMTILVGDSEPAYTYTVTGLADDDTNAVITTAPTFSVAGFSSASPTTFTIAISGGAANVNYTIGTYTNGTLTVTSKNNVSASITFLDGSATYTGSVLSHETATYNSSGANITYTYTADTGTLSGGKPLTAGTYTVTAKYEDASNIGTKTANFTIDKATPSYTVPTGLTAIYGQTLADVNIAANTGFSWMNNSTSVGAVSSRTHQAKFTPTDTGNYNIVDNINVTVAVTAKAITITPDANQNKNYGSADPTLTYTSSETLIAGNSFSGALSRATGENVGTYAINLGTLSAGSNYTLTLFATPVSFTINKAAYTGTKTASAEVRAGKATTNATLILPTLPEGASYLASGTIGGALVSSNSITGRQLTYSTTSQAAGASATITIPVTNATNYNAYDVTVTITASDATAAEKVAEDLDALTFADIKNANIVPNDITTDLDLISTGTVHGSAIAWTSNHSAINVTNGAVTRQSSDTAVILTATIANGTATATKVFRLTVTAAPPPTGNIGGTVTDESDSPLPNLTVKIMIGGSINGTVVGSTTTDANGKYSFGNLPYGVYSLVVYDGTNTVTRLIIIKSASVTEDVKMPAGNQNTYVEVNGSETPSVATGNLEEMFTPADKAAAQEAGASVEIKLVVEQVQSPPDENIVLQTLGSGKELGFYLNAELLKTITGSANDDVDGEKIQPPTGTTLTVVIDLPPELQNMAPYSIIRVHTDTTTGIADVKTITAPDLQYDSTLHTLTFEADLFSTYAIAYTSTSPNPPVPPTSPPSNGGSSSGGNHNAATAPAIISTYWIEKAEAKTMAKSATEQGAEIARSRRSTITGIRKASLLLLSESGLRYQHDTVVNNAVQVRAYVNDPGKAAKDILVSGYVAGDTVDKTKAIFGKWYPNKIAVISFDAQGDFGMKAEVAAKVDLSGMDTSKLYFYSYDKAANKYKRIQTEYRIDASGYLHFATTLAGSIIITDASLSGNTEPQNPGTGGDGADWNTNDLHNPTTGGDGMITPPTQVQPQVSVTADTLPEAATVDSGVLKLEIRTVPTAINNTDGEIGGALVFDLDAHAESADSKKSNLWLFGGIGALMLLIAVTVSWVLIPRRNDPLVSVEEYRKKE